MGTRPRAAGFSLEPAPGQPSEPTDGHLARQSLQPGSPLAPGEPGPSPPLRDGHCPASLAKPEPSPACLCSVPGGAGCPGRGCGALGPFEPSLGTSGGHFPCPPSNHPKLKKTWLTRHSEQSLPRCKAARRDSAHELGTEGKRSAKRPHGTGDSAGVAKRSSKATEGGAAACQGDGTDSRGHLEEKRMELGEGGKAEGCVAGLGAGRCQRLSRGWYPSAQGQVRVGQRCCAQALPGTNRAWQPSPGVGMHQNAPLGQCSTLGCDAQQGAKCCHWVRALLGHVPASQP